MSPVFDLLFLANLGWLVLLIPGIASSTDTPIDFWQIYYLTLPHRWITLVLVVMDPDRREGQTGKLWGIAILAALAVVGAYGITGTFLCLAMVDFLWNAWHFASQHAGVLRIYTRKVGGGNFFLERWGLRLFITYAALRGVGWTTGWLEGDATALQVLFTIDHALLAIPVALIITNIPGWNRHRTGKLVYLTSVCLLYVGFLLALQHRWTAGILVFAAAGSMFHAVEYLAIVTFYAQRRTQTGSQATFQKLAQHWLLFLALYILLLGSLGTWMADPDHGVIVFWQGLNLWAAFIHYGFDGVIWKLRKPATASALGASSA